MSTLAGQSIGKYKLLERRGRGGMAEVYKAHHPKLDRVVAVKILHGYLAEGPDFLGRFEREAKAVANLRHPHIVQIHDFDVDNDTYYMVMEYIAGGTLQDLMNAAGEKGEYIPLGQVLAILQEVAGAMDYAHDKGIIHRDIKPSNILLDETGEAFLADFGIARMVSTTQFTSTGALIGTPTYMSPEQSKGMELTPVSDIYSLGIILYEVLTGQAPFAADTPLAVIQKHVSEPLPAPEKLRPGLTPGMAEVLTKALAKDPAERYQSAGELARALAQVLTLDLIAELDQGSGRKKSKLSPQPTEMMEESDMPRRANLPTVEMGTETQAEIAGSLPPKPVAKSEDRIPPEAVMEIKSGREEKSSNAAHPSFKERLKSKAFLFGLISIVVVVALVILFSLLSPGGDCRSVEACLALAEDLNRQGDLEGAIDAFRKAGELVPLQDHGPNAWIWCSRADLLDLVGRQEEAFANREMCATWERGE